ncbi:3-deoxy-manno-octulosonate cytidylyltransferase (CMP-KDO synthetase) [Desulfocicer vacuolatum DSM 3385]|uniref:3-deoxy-manno-octulosonate cytidylyltransferase n=1 Tax=Desulfocicer vacuolatum DSM 3385 TaxID=1121400 RepID=A0A1W1Z8F4_9BACT|nr:3-deoxy-manno-octulosonate cytidylyltransferase [Desulfocicer vacuolatum]SMC44703.1 3-deoxy-manno-octulosonate cytidylyltransferase (CMP-KDO synthetase) [Desulfocicer vacuolatum DSM 3385]
MTLAVIPSRYGSKRFNGKPLVLVAGKPMIQRVYEQAAKAGSIDRVVVATDDQRIYDTVLAFGGEAVMTPSDLKSGTDRVWEACQQFPIDDNEVVINIQGDQPVFSPECLDQLTTPFDTDPGLNMSTLALEITDPRDLTDPSAVKVTLDRNGFALYFSRSQIPFPRDGQCRIPTYRHLGFYAYRKSFLQKFTALGESLLENTEKLEQLRVLEYGHAIKVVITAHDSPSVDLPGDIERVEAFLPSPADTF